MAWGRVSDQEIIFTFLSNLQFVLKLIQSVMELYSRPNLSTLRSGVFVGGGGLMVQPPLLTILHHIRIKACITHLIGSRFGIILTIGLVHWDEWNLGQMDQFPQTLGQERRILLLRTLKIISPILVFQVEREPCILVPWL